MCLDSISSCGGGGGYSIDIRVHIQDWKRGVLPVSSAFRVTFVTS